MHVVLLGDSIFDNAAYRVLALRRPTVLCTIYNGRLEPEVARIAELGVALFNDVILRTAAKRNLDAIELRLICDEPADYANPIEPSGTGGLKIARAITRALGIDRDGRAPRVWR